MIDFLTDHLWLTILIILLVIFFSFGLHHYLYYLTHRKKVLAEYQANKQRMKQENPYTFIWEDKEERKMQRHGFYFDTEDHYMYTGYHAINGELYYFNADGSCWGKCGPQSGWYQAEGKWYFMKGGYVTTGSAYINGITYQFDDDGVMQE